MIIKHSEEGDNGVFYIEENGQLLAEMTYQKDNESMVVDHTQVDESLQGKNVGFELVEKGVEYAREANLRMVPVCEFAKAVIEKTKKFQDVL